MLALDDTAYADLLHRTLLTAHVLGRWQVAQTVALPAQFAETLSDAEIARLLRSPLLVERAQEIMLSKRLMSKYEFASLQRKKFLPTLSGVPDFDRKKSSSWCKYFEKMLDKKSIILILRLYSVSGKN